MWLKIKILLWKSLQYRKKFWLFTLIEIIFPCLIFSFLKYLIIYVKVEDPSSLINDLKDHSKKFPVFLTSITTLSFLLMCSLTIKRIGNEKYSGIKELMKMMGLESWMIWTGWILHNLFINTISIIVILFILYYGGGEILVYSNVFLILIFFVMYTIAGTFFCFAISSLCNQPLLALITGVFIWIPSYSFPLFAFLIPSIRNKLIVGLSVLFPNSAMTSAFITITFLESNQTGLQLSSLFTPLKDTNERDYDSVGSMLLIFVLQCFVYGFIAWYVDLIKPGYYGSAKPLNFFFKWSKNKVENYEMTHWNESNSRIFEDPLHGCEVGISVQHLHKRFGNFHAINGVNLDFYKGQITVLLGHNGAGKTTTMSIITGLFSPSHGRVIFNGNDIFSNIDQYRKHLGLCPQHNLHFSYLTTLDHLIFFGMLKGMTSKEAKSQGLDLLKLLNILHKQDNLVNELSGGMRRKLSLAIALVGSPDILILDEPTSGMDTVSRREIWDLILSLRESKTILITTQFMEEADVLGDRIAIMDHGKVKCYGTSLFLKKAYGIGYNLTIVKEQSCNESKIIAEIKKIIPEVKIQSSITSQVLINVNDEFSEELPKVLKMLQKKKKTFGIKEMGIACTTMEEVFLRAEKNIQFETDLSQSSVHKSLDMDSYQLIIKKEVDCNDDQVKKLIQQYVPEFSLLSRTETQTIYNLPAVNNSLSKYQPLMSALKTEERNLKLKSFKLRSPTLSDVYPKISDDNHELKESPIGMLTLIPNKSSRVDLIQQFKILMKKKVIYTYRRWCMTLIIGIIPIFFGIFLSSITHEDRIDKILWYIFFNPSLLYFQGYCMALPFKERQSGFKHLQLMTNLSPITYWTACFLWDYFCYTIVITITVVFMYLFDVNNIYNNSNLLYVLWILLFTFGLSGIINAYVYSFFSKSYIGCMVLFITVNLTMFLLIAITNISNYCNCITITPVAKYIFLSIPYCSFSIITSNFLKMKRIKLNDRNITPSFFEFKSEENKYGILEETLCLLFSSVLYTVLILLFEYKIFKRIHHFVFSKIVRTNNVDINDSGDVDIDDERHKVDEAKKHLGDEQFPMFIVDDLVKKFNSEFTGVRGISFTVSPGECFGLLGVNGAGKTTTFRVLTGDIYPSKGNAFIQTNKLYNLNSNMSQFVSMIGYCPQFDALNDQLTARETLKLIAILRGISPKYTEEHVNNLITVMGLEQYKDRPCGNYSGGNKRKLSTAVALIGDPPVVFLDEPTSGVDPVSRRNLWKLLASNRRRGQTVLLTSHSMDECEALCNRLTIMVDGVMKCIGNVQYLKNRYGQGYTVMVKLSNNKYSLDIANLKADLESRFSPGIHLKDEHRGLLHYHITNPQKSLSDIFDQMKLIKENFTSVEDYTIHDTTLEQVFIAFAKGQAVCTLKTE